jgi:hypothetical protein
MMPNQKLRRSGSHLLLLVIWGSVVIPVNSSLGIQVHGREQRPQQSVVLKTVHHVRHEDCNNNYYNNNPHNNLHHHLPPHEYQPNYLQPVPEPEPQPIVYDYGSYDQPVDDGRGRGGMTISMNNIRLTGNVLRRMLNRMPRMTININFD